MVQYGYCNYITDEKLVEFNTYVKDGKLVVKDRVYSTMLILYSPFIKEEILDLLQEFVQSGGKLIWSSVYPLMTNEDNTTLDKWKALFGINDIQKAYIGKIFKDNNVKFINTLSDVEDMKILTDMRVDEVYPLIILDGECIAKIDEFSVGSLKRYDNDGVALYLGFRPRDDQSQSLGKDISTLSTIINVIGGYSLDSLEMKSRDTNSRYIYNQFNNGSISIANHYRTFYEDWDGKFFRDKKSDKASLQNRELTPIDINLCETINEHHIKYCGTGVLTYTVNDGNLVGFAGKETKGITIDSKKYVFSDIANDITWTKVEKEFLSDGIEELYVIKVKSYGQITLPIALKDSDEYKACICKNMILESDIEFNFKLEKITQLLT